jgi:WD40 repeat protein
VSGDLPADMPGTDVPADSSVGIDGGAGGSPCGVLGWGLDTIAAIAPGGASVAFATADGRLEVRRWSDNIVLGIDNGLFGATAIAYSADGALFAASTAETLKIWRTSDGALLRSIPELASGRGVGLSNDGSVVAVSRNYQIRVSRPAGLLTVPGGGAAGVAVSPDGTLVAGSYEMPNGATLNNRDFWNGVWRVSDGQPVWASGSGSSAMPTTAHALFSPDGARVAFGRGGAQNFSTGRVLQAATGAVVSSINAELMAFTSDGLGIIGDPQEQRRYVLYRVSDGVSARTFDLPPNATVLAAGFSTGTTTLVAVQRAGTDDQMLLVDGAEARTITRPGSQFALSSVAVSPDGSLVFTGAMAGVARLWNATTSLPVSTFPLGRQGVQASAFSPDSTRLATCAGGGVSVHTVKANGSVLASPTPAFTIPVAATAVAFSPNGMLIATGNDDNTAVLWNAVGGTAVRTLWNLSGHTRPVTGVAFSPDGTRVATVANDRTIKIWNVADGAEIRTISAGTDSANVVRFSPDGAAVVGDPGGGGATFWDVATGSKIRSVPGSSNPVFSPRGPMMLLGASGGIERFSLPALDDLGQLAGSVTRGYVRALDITPSGAVLASVADSAVARLWCAP